MPEFCYACRPPTYTPAVDEYHWWTDDDVEIVWMLCEDCSDFALEAAETIVNIEEEVQQWVRDMTT